MARRTTSRNKPAATNKARRAPATTTRTKSSEPVVVASKVKATLKHFGCNTSGDALEGLNAWAYWLIDQAAKRARANGRKTVRAHDFFNF